jgi:thiol-disulfide isomerase/thioredoxin
MIFDSDARSCHTCDKVLAELEKIDDDTDNFGVDFIKINDKRLAKKYGIKTFPALTYFREKEPIIYEGECFATLLTERVHMSLKSMTAH